MDWGNAFTILGGIGTLFSGAVLFIITRFRPQAWVRESQEQHSKASTELLSEVRASNDKVMNEVRAAHESERQAWRQEQEEQKARVTKLAERLDKSDEDRSSLRKELVATKDLLVEAAKREGELKAKVARLEVEVEFLRNGQK